MRALILNPRYADPSQRAVGRALRALGVELTVLVPERWRAPGSLEVHLPAFGDDAGMRIVPVAVSGDLDDPDRLRWSRGTVRRTVRDLRPEIVHVEREPWSPAASLAVGAARAIKVPVTLAGTESVRVAHSFGERLRRGRVLRAVSGIAGSNQHALALLGPAAVSAILPDSPTPLPLRVVRQPHEGIALGFVGRLVPERGCDLLLEACLRLRGPWTLSIAGTGPSQEPLEALAERLGIASRIRWLGGLPLEKLDELWPALDVIVLPARTTEQWIEPSAAMVRLAMAHGVAAIGSTSGALPEVIGKAGVIVPEGNAGALADAVQNLADDPSELERYRELARARVMQEFVAEAIARQTVAFWERALATAAAKGQANR